MPDPRDPFKILGIGIDAEPEVITAAYRALARKYHPDLNPRVAAAELNSRMVDINWAKRELEESLDNWRLRQRSQPREATQEVRRDRATRRAKPAGSPRTSATAEPARRHVVRGAVTTDPQVVFLSGLAGASATFDVRAPGAPRGAIKARFKGDNIEVVRLEDAIGVCRFSASLKDEFSSDIEDSLVIPIDLVADGYVGCRAFISIAPVNRRVMDQEYAGRIAPARHASSSARISFGKHRTRMFSQIALDEPGYLRWMLREGAGTNIERQCAQLALHERFKIDVPQRRAAQSVPAVLGRVPAATGSLPTPERKSDEKPSALPDPARKGGVLDSIRSLFAKRA